MGPEEAAGPSAPGPSAPGSARPSDPRPSDALDASTWDRSHERLVETLRELIRIPSVNPPDPPGPERDAADHAAAILEDAGLEATVYEPVAGRGSVVARLHGDGTGGDPLLLLSHLDVVPAPPGGWTHDPFAADVADGYVYGRGAVDMKDLVAMELEVIRLLAERARSAGRDPARDPVPGLRRDVLFACTADEEAGGLVGAGWLVDTHPEHLRAAGAINESGGVSLDVRGTRLYPIQVAEKGYVVFRIVIAGTWGHGSMPREDNAALLAAQAISRLSAPWAPRLTPVMRTFLLTAADAVEPETALLLRALAGDDPRRAEIALDRLCSPVYARAARALLRDTISVGIVRAGIKYNVIPGEATIEIDCRVLPGVTADAMEAEVRERLGPDLEPRCRIERTIAADPVVAPDSGPLYDVLVRSIRDHDPEGVPVPVMAPFATDAKHLVRIGVPAYGFSPLRLDPDEAYLARYHGVDERVSLDALRWGLPVLYDAVVRFCG